MFGYADSVGLPGSVASNDGCCSPRSRSLSMFEQDIMRRRSAMLLPTPAGG